MRKYFFLIKYGIPYLLLLCTFSSALAHAATPSELQSANNLFHQIKQRVDLMQAVALYKWKNHIPVEDLPREKIVLDNTRKEAADAGILYIDSLTSAQIQIAKNEQNRWIKKWTANAPAANQHTPALRELRDQLDALSNQFMATLQDALPSLRDEKLHPRLRLLLDQQLEKLPARERKIVWDALLKLRFAPRRNTPPIEKSTFHASDLVELKTLDATFKLDIRYATQNNFAHQKVYTQARAFLQRPAAMALLRVSHELQKKGYGLIIFDGYRPWSVTKKFWDITPDDRKQFVADPNQGSRHNRGCAIDVSLYNLKTGKPLPMPSGYDDFTAKAYPSYSGGSEQARKNRDLLAHIMTQQGFSIYPTEWWHFDYQDWRHYPILNIPFEQLHLDGTR